MAQKNRIAVLETTKGTITIELFEDTMPITTQHFISLVQKGFYDGTRFHRVIPQFMIQGGDPLTKDFRSLPRWGTGGPGFTIKDEFVSGLSNVRGTIAMANTGQPNSGGSQFFINVNDNIFLDFDKPPLASRHPVFGKVVSGMDVVDAIVTLPRNGQDRPIEDVILTKVTIIS
ncbi:peptidylprolyl isomerase [Candidatus Woesearchaeota archaeon]|nr:peptidylprolyl isomerase [Candidatus Woesearchaeota archaeon]